MAKEQSHDFLLPNQTECEASWNSPLPSGLQVHRTLIRGADRCLATAAPVCLLLSLPPLPCCQPQEATETAAPRHFCQLVQKRPGYLEAQPSRREGGDSLPVAFSCSLESNRDLPDCTAAGNSCSGLANSLKSFIIHSVRSLSSPFSKQNLHRRLTRRPIYCWGLHRSLQRAVATQTET